MLHATSLRERILSIIGANSRCSESRAITDRPTIAEFDAVVPCDASLGGVCKWPLGLKVLS